MSELSKVNKAVLEDVSRALGEIDEREIFRLLEAVAASRRVYVAGAGRSLCAARAFAQRLYQCGIDVYVCGDTNLPPAAAGDLLIACSSSGETSAVMCMAGRAKDAGCRIAAITSSPDSSIAETADITVFVHLPARQELCQPMGTLFEQSVFILLDCAVILLMEKLGLVAADLKKRHGNLE